MTRYWVRVGADVRGPVDETTIAGWLAHGMRGAEVCVEGTNAFFPIEQTPLAQYVPGANGGMGKRFAGGGGIIVALIVVSLLGRGMNVCNRGLDERKKQAATTLPAVGTKGVLHAGGKEMFLCPQEKYGFGWPCRKGTVVSDRSPVQVMKTEADALESKCRYWVQGGPQDGVAGDAPCDWFTPARHPPSLR